MERGEVKSQDTEEVISKSRGAMKKKTNTRQQRWEEGLHSISNEI